MRRTCGYVFLSLLVLAPLGCGQASGDEAAPVHAAPVLYPFELTPEEIRLARTLAEQDLAMDSLDSLSRTVFIKIDLLPDSEANTSQRLVMVHHYRYLTDETLFTMVDLHARAVLKRQVGLHYPTGLASSEIQHALELAHVDPRLQALLPASSTNVQTRPIQYGSPDAPLHGHRVVQLLLMRDGAYISTPRVLVDLTTETVHLEK